MSPAPTPGTEAAVPIDRVARLLLSLGSRREALTLLRAAVGRDPAESACAVLLRWARERPHLSPSAPGADLDLDVIEGWIRAGMLVEALSVLQGTLLRRTPEGMEWARLLGEILAPPPAGCEEVFAEVHRQLCGGAAVVAVTLLEERAKERSAMPAWARRRLSLLRWLLFDNAPAAAPTPRSAKVLTSELARRVNEQIEARNMPGALHVAREHRAAHPQDAEAGLLLSALEQLVGSCLQSTTPESLESTMQVQGHLAATMQLMMGNLLETERIYRRIATRNPHDRRAQRALEDLQVLGSVLRGEPGGPTPAIVPNASSRTPGAVDDDATDLALPVVTDAMLAAALADEDTQDEPLRAGPSRGADLFDDVTVSRPRITMPDLWDVDETATNDEEPEAKAALALVQGRHQEALMLYSALAARHPGDPRYQERLAQCIEHIEQQHGPVDADEVTVVTTVPESLRSELVPTDMRMSAAVRHARMGSASQRGDAIVLVSRIVTVGRTAS